MIGHQKQERDVPFFETIVMPGCIQNSRANRIKTEVIGAARECTNGNREYSAPGDPAGDVAVAKVFSIKHAEIIHEYFMLPSVRKIALGLGLWRLRFGAVSCQGLRCYRRSGRIRGVEGQSPLPERTRQTNLTFYDGGHRRMAMSRGSLGYETHRCDAR